MPRASSPIKISVPSANSAFSKRRRTTFPRPRDSSAPFNRKVQRPRVRTAPVRLNVSGAAQKQAKAPNFLAVRRNKTRPIERPHALRSRPEVSFQGGKQTRHQTRPASAVIFAERIAQFDRSRAKPRLTFVGRPAPKCEPPQNPRDQSLPQPHFPVVATIRARSRRESAAICARNSVNPKNPHNLLDQVLFAAKIGTMTGNAPTRSLIGRA